MHRQACLLPNIRGKVFNVSPLNFLLSVDFFTGAYFSPDLDRYSEFTDATREINDDLLSVHFYTLLCGVLVHLVLIVSPTL